MAWLTLAAFAQPATNDITYMNDREFRIPITLPDDPTERANLERLYLYVSSDGGKSWRMEKTASPKDEEFPYLAPGDGVYWFSVQTEDKQKKLKPIDIAAEGPGLKVVVDTRKPVIGLQAERQGDQVTITWDIRDDNPDLSSFKLEYRVADSPRWDGIPISPPSMSGQHRLTVNGLGMVSVRLQVQDYAHNMGMKLAEAVESSSDRVTRPVSLEPGSNPAMAVPNNVRPPTQALQPPTPPNAALPVAEEVKPRSIARTNKSEPQWTAAGSSGTAAGMSKAPNAMAASKPSGFGPALKYTNQRRLGLNYNVKTGPSGIGTVQLWMTRDEGRTWEKSGETQTATSPFPIELPPEDGIYGFILVVRSKANLGRPDPRPGEAPDVRIELDTTPPEGSLDKVEADPRRKDTLFLYFSAKDKNLTATPITLKWTDKPGGEWKTIAEHITLGNGKYPWIMPEGLPFQVYLRMEIRDLAGNVSIADSEEPVIIDLQAPVVEVKDFVIEPQPQKP
jgi:hypothetical protein